jgi:surfeit locus 1 family protein
MPLNILKTKSILPRGALRFKQYQWQFKFWPCLLALGMLIILMMLGLWQLQRYHFKQALQQRYQQSLHQIPIDFTQLNTQSDIRFTHVHIMGQYLNDRTMLLGNRFYHDQLGFEVLTPFQMKGSPQLLLINRGWIAKPKTTALPVIPSITGTQQLNGYIQVLGNQGFILGNAILTPTQWPLLLQKIDVPALSQLTQLSFYPFVVRLDADQPGGFVSVWQPITMTPERHLGYAVQWFAMALALIIAFVFFSLRKEEKQHE